MFNFFTKKQKNQLNSNAEENQKLVNEMWQENYNNAVNNTVAQNFTAEQYNNQARQNGEQDWQTAYRRDILWKNEENQKLAQNVNQTPQPQVPQVEQKQPTQEEITAEERKQAEAQGKTYISQADSDTYNKEQARLKAEAEAKAKKQAEEAKKAQEQNNQETQATTKNTENAWTEAKTEPTTWNVDYSTWDVEWWKKRWSSKEELENAVEKKYETVANYDENWNLTAVINWEKFQWKMDSNWNPVKTSLWKADAGDINRNNFFQMVQGWSSTKDLNDYIQKNNLSGDTEVQNALKQKYIDDYEKPILKKYSGYSLDDLHKAVSNGEIVVWSDVFNKLPQAQAYNQMKWVFAVIDARKKRDWSWIDAITEIWKYMDSRLSEFFDSAGAKALREEYEAKNPELQEYRQNIERSKKIVNDFDRQKKSLARSIRDNMRGANEAMIQAEIARQTEDLYLAVKSETDNINTNLALIDDVRKDFSVRSEMMRYEDWLKREKFNVASKMYYTERDKMEEKEKAEYEAKTKELAEERQKAWELKKIELNNKYKWWEYKTDVNGNLFYVKDGEATIVRNSESWEVIGFNRTWEYQDQVQKNSVWGYDVIRTYKDWRMPEIYSVWANWKFSWGATFGLMDAIWRVPTKWKWPNWWLRCGEWVNYYLKWLWINSFRIWDSWESKKNLIDSSSPVVWGLVAFNIWGKYGENWHIGIVSWINWTKVQITDWNKKWDWQKSIYEMEISSVLNSDWGFVNWFLWQFAWNNQTQNSEGATNYSWVTSYDNKNISMYKKFLNKWLTKEDWKNIWENAEIFKQKAYLYWQEQQQIENDVKWSSLYEIYNYLKEIREKPVFAWTWARDDFTNKLNFVKNNLTFDKLTELKSWGATFGALSEWEWRAIANAASRLDFNFFTTDWSWSSRVDDTLRKMEKTFQKLGFDYRAVKDKSIDEITTEYGKNNGNSKSTNVDTKQLQKKYFKD